jgi:hypothetical protein
VAGMNLEIGGDASGALGALAETQAAISGLTGKTVEVEVITTGAGGAADGLGRLREGADEAGDAHDRHTESLGRNEEALGRASDGAKEHADATDRGSESLREHGDETERSNESLGKNADAHDRASDAVAQHAEQEERAASSVQQHAEQTDALSAAMERVQAGLGTESLAQSVEGHEQAAQSVARHAEQTDTLGAALARVQAASEARAAGDPVSPLQTSPPEAPKAQAPSTPSLGSQDLPAPTAIERTQAMASATRQLESAQTQAAATSVAYRKAFDEAYDAAPAGADATEHAQAATSDLRQEMTGARSDFRQAGQDVSAMEKAFGTTAEETKSLGDQLEAVTGPLSTIGTGAALGAAGGGLIGTAAAALGAGSAMEQIKQTPGLMYAAGEATRDFGKAFQQMGQQALQAGLPAMKDVQASAGDLGKVLAGIGTANMGQTLEGMSSLTRGAAHMAQDLAPAVAPAEKAFVDLGNAAMSGIGRMAPGIAQLSQQVSASAPGISQAITGIGNGMTALASSGARGVAALGPTFEWAGHELGGTGPISGGLNAAAGPGTDDTAGFLHSLIPQPIRNALEHTPILGSQGASANDMINGALGGGGDDPMAAATARGQQMGATWAHTSANALAGDPAPLGQDLGSVHPDSSMWPGQRPPGFQQFGAGASTADPLRAAMGAQPPPASSRSTTPDQPASKDFTPDTKSQRYQDQQAAKQIQEQHEQAPGGHPGSSMGLPSPEQATQLAGALQQVHTASQGAQQSLGQIGSSAQGSMQQASQSAQQLPQQMAKPMQSLPQQMAAPLAQLPQAMQQAMQPQQLAAPMQHAVQSAVSQVQPAAESGGSDLGASIGTGAAKGVTKEEDNVVTVIRKTIEHVINEGADALDSHSPSQVFVALGQSIPQGLAVGIQSQAQIATGATQQMMGQIVGVGQTQSAAAQSQLGASGSGMASMLGPNGALGGVNPSQLGSNASALNSYGNSWNKFAGQYRDSRDLLNRSDQDRDRSGVNRGQDRDDQQDQGDSRRDQDDPHKQQDAQFDKSIDKLGYSDSTKQRLDKERDQHDDRAHQLKLGRDEAHDSALDRARYGDMPSSQVPMGMDTEMGEASHWDALHPKQGWMQPDTQAAQAQQQTQQDQVKAQQDAKQTSPFEQLSNVMGQMGGALGLSKTDDQMNKAGQDGGKSLQDGTAKGIQDNQGTANSAASGAATSVQNTTKKANASSSPSMVYAAMGSDLMAGMALGITGSTGMVSDSLSSTMDAATAGVQATASNNGLMVGYAYADNILTGVQSVVQSSTFASSAIPQLSSALATTALGQLGDLGPAGGAGQIPNNLQVDLSNTAAPAQQQPTQTTTVTNLVTIQGTSLVALIQTQIESAMEQLGNAFQQN